MILLTGVTGTTGQEVLKQLATTGQPVRVLVRNPEKAAKIQAEFEVETAIGDFDQPETLDAALAGIERAFLLPANTLQQVQQEANFIEAASGAGIKHIVKYSARGADIHAAARVTQWHGQTEKLLESGIAYTHLRPIFFMQNLLGNARLIATDGTFALPMGTAKVALTDIRDIAAVAVAALTQVGHEGKAYNITGPKALSMDEVADILSAAIGKNVTYVDAEPEAFKQGLIQSGLPEWYADDLVKLNAYNAGPEGTVVTNVVRDVAKKEPITFEQFAKDYASVFRSK